MPAHNAAQHRQALLQARRAEDNEGAPQHHNGAQVLKEFRQLPQQGAQAQMLKAEQRAVHKAEGQIFPRRAVPQPGECKDDEQIETGAPQAAAAAAQRNVDIIPEPAGQRDVPPPPVFADGAGKVGVVEVFRQGDTEEFSDADGHIAVAGKVKIQLHHIRRVAQHQNRRGQRGGRHGGDPCVNQRQLVRNQRFFGQPQHQPLDAVAEAVGRDTALCAAGVKLRGLLAVADNRAGRAMAEEGQKHRKPEGAFFRFGAARSHIRAVADGREHIEADAQRQGGGECRQQPGRNRVERLRGKARVPEPAQHGQIQHRQ